MYHKNIHLKVATSSAADTASGEDMDLGNTITGI